MRILTGLLLIFLSGCGSIPTCGTKSIKIQAPSSLPFVGSAPFVIERSNDHVDCERDPSERDV